MQSKIFSFFTWSLHLSANLFLFGLRRYLVSVSRPHSLIRKCAGWFQSHTDQKELQKTGNPNPKFCLNLKDKVSPASLSSQSTYRNVWWQKLNPHQNEHCFLKSFCLIYGKRRYGLNTTDIFNPTVFFSNCLSKWCTGQVGDSWDH